ncbi:MAG: hypothetical protein LBJ46_06565 [Planctomycetota bacterium]|jgi:hypothetical protein|nr:hypothetical protein [Planctomycetota bacterium]
MNAENETTSVENIADDPRSPASAPASKRRKRGSVLIFALIASAVLAASVASVSESSADATNALNTQDSEAQSASAAEFGAKLAVAEITSWTQQEGNAGKDWVAEAPYVGDSGEAKDNRRFNGLFGDREFRVMVRSAGLAKEFNTKEDTWLWTPQPNEVLYEIVSAARPRDVDVSSLPAERRTGAVVNQVVNILNQRGWSGGKERGPFETSRPQNFQATLGSNTRVLGAEITGGSSGGSSSGSLSEGEMAGKNTLRNIHISGEDHEINKYYVAKFESERIVTPLKLTTNTANFFGAYGGYWSSGQLTLNYRMEPDTPLANPHRPKTPNFGTGQNDRAMFVADKNREYDTYLLGGKQSRTVTLNADRNIDGVTGYINETNSAQANEGGSFNIVLGAFEDLRNLYINMAGVVGSYTDPLNWWQMYVGQYSHSRRGANGTVCASLPNYSGSRVRAQTVHLMKNKDGHFLVRLYAKRNGSNTTYYKYQESGSYWTGYYCWADATFNGSGLTLNRTFTPAANSTTPREVAGQRAVARSFFWQELVGYQLVRRYERNPGISDPNEPAIVSQRDVPADGSQRIDKRTIYRVDSEGERLPAGFDEIYQADKNAGVHGNATNSQHPLYPAKYSAVTPGYLQDRFDTIYVQNNDGSITEHPDMRSFLFEKDFGNDADGNPIVRDALALFIAYEDQRETTADYNYTDMMFTIYIAPTVEQVIVPYTMFTLLTDQWWEQNPDNGLTGRPAHPALVTNQDESTFNSGDPLRDNFDLLGYSSLLDPSDPDMPSFEENVFTMREGNNQLEGNVLLRAQFEEDGSGGLKFVPTLDADGRPILNKPYYYTEDDVNNFYIHEWNLGNKAVATVDGRVEARRRFMGMISRAGVVIRDTTERWDQATVSKSELTGDRDNTAYQVSNTVEAFRQMAADILGFKYQNVPVVKTFEYAPVRDEDNNRLTPESTALGFLAGEMVQGSNTLEIDPARGVGVPHLARQIAQADGIVTPIRAFVHEDPALAVEMAYQDYYLGDPGAKQEMETIYGVKDKRYSIGFHRSGEDERFAERYSQDHYEVVSLGQLGFNPYMTTVDEKSIVRNTVIDPSGPDHPVYKYEFKYGKPGLVPDFVFDRPIDGAGILVINGNLVIEDTFAYHGLLLVLGDVVIRPTYKPNRFVYGADGNPRDAYGNSIYRNGSGKWVYTWMDPEDSSNVRETELILDDDGTPLRDDSGQSIPVTPLYAAGADAYRGRLVVQGSLLVNGALTTETVENQFNPGEMITGELHCFASGAAVDLTDRLSGIKKDVVEVVSWSNGGNNEALNRDLEYLWNGLVEN